MTIAYHQEANAFAIGCVRTDPSQTGAPDVVTSSFKLIDALTYERMHSRFPLSYRLLTQLAADINSYVLGTQEEVTKIAVVELSVQGELGWYIVVGTAIWDDTGMEPTKGRILLFRTQTGKPRTAAKNKPAPAVLLSMDEQVPGSVVDMEVVDGKLAVIVNTIVSSC
jgi:CPSF A subunit region